MNRMRRLWRRSGWLLLAAAGLVLLVGAVGRWFLARPSPRAGAVLLADLANQTGERILEDSIREALLTALDQSPFLAVVPHSRIREALPQVGRTPAQRVDEAAARALCDRESIPTIVTGSLARAGGGYTLDVRALDCGTGRRVASVSATVPDQGGLLGAVDDAARAIRGGLGEPPDSIEQFGRPVEEALTASLSALRLFAFGERWRRNGSLQEAFPFFQRALAADPEFALAYARLAETMSAASNAPAAIANVEQAFARRDRLTRKEQFRATAAHFGVATGEYDKYLETLEQYARTYPRDAAPRHDLAVALNLVGDFERAAAEEREALRLNPTRALPTTLLASYVGAGRFDDARRFYEQALAQRPDLGPARLGLYPLAFVASDAEAMRRQAGWTAGRPEEPVMLSMQAQVAAFEGRLRESRAAYDRAVGILARTNRSNDIQAIRTAEALAHALYGVRTHAARVLPPVGDDIGPASAQIGVVAALLDRRASADAVAAQLGARYPLDTFVTDIWIPTIRSARALTEGRYADAVTAGRSARRYDRSPVAQYLPPYLQAEAERRAGNGIAARRDYQIVLDNRGVLPVSPVYALAQAGLARAAMLAGDVRASRDAYEKAVQIWKNADQDVPLICEVRREAEAARTAALR